MKDEMVGTVTILNVARLGDGSTTPFYTCNNVGLGRIKNNEFMMKFMGSYGLGGSQPLATLYGGIAGSPISDFALQTAEVIGSMYLGTHHSAIRSRIKMFSTSGALYLRGRVANANAGTPIWAVKLIIGRTIAPV